MSEVFGEIECSAISGGESFWQKGGGWVQKFSPPPPPKDLIYKNCGIENSRGIVVLVIFYIGKQFVVTLIGVLSQEYVSISFCLVVGKKMFFENARSGANLFVFLEHDRFRTFTQMIFVLLIFKVKPLYISHF